jgi:SAM-dependent methyltransferase
MELKDALALLLSPPPGPEEAGTDSIWTDPHISAKLLEAHLDSSTDAASRRPEAIESALSWILGRASAAKRILDLGCGPGLYAERLARTGREVVGIDFNAASLGYARESARGAGLSIDYRLGSYLELPYPEGIDAALMIFCDFGALDDAGRRLVLRKLKASLAPGGLFFFDVFGLGLLSDRKAGRGWRVESGGFYSAGPCLLLEEDFLFPEARSATRQILALEETGRARLFRIHDTCFDRQSLELLLGGEGFELLEAKRGILPPPNFGSDDVIFVAARRA